MIYISNIYIKKKNNGIKSNWPTLCIDQLKIDKVANVVPILEC